jgi:methyltransferase (TIGR00027 family)
MEAEQVARPSFTAVAVARHKRDHVLLDGGRFLRDDLVGRLVASLEDGAAQVGTRAARRNVRKKMSAVQVKARHFLAMRSAVAEQLIQERVASGEAQQVVLLGAGLDTFFYRTRLPPSVVCIEADLGNTQTWKRARLAELQIDASHVHFVRCDLRGDAKTTLERDSPFDSRKKSVFVLLGVVPYLTREATLHLLGGLSPGVVVFDFGEPLENASPATKARFEKRSVSVQEAGEPWLSQWDPAELAAQLKNLGFDTVQMFGPLELAARFFAGSLEWVQKRGPHPCTICVTSK